MTINQNELRTKLRDIREEDAIAWKAFAAQIGISRWTLNRFINKESPVSDLSLLKIRKYLLHKEDQHGNAQ